jgi:hypothetical protein
MPTMKSFACLALVVVAACGDDGASPVDAANPDAAVDAEIDAPPVTYSGTMTALEVAALAPAPAPAGTIFGQGVQIGISFVDSEHAVAPTMEEQPGSPLGCKLFEYTPRQLQETSVGLDEGPVKINVTRAAQGAPQYPDCTFTAGVGYTCPHMNTKSTGGVIAPLPNMPNVATLTDPDVTYTANNTANRYVNITGATNPGNDGTFPIVQLAGANTIAYVNPAVVAETIPATGSHINLAGVGPTPSVPDEGFLFDDDGLSMMLTAGGGRHFADFTATTGAAPASIGDDFEMPDAERAKLRAIPNDGQAFTISCADANTACGAASGSLLLLYTTDAPVANVSPFTLPPPVTKRVMVRCAAIGQTSVTVPAPYMAAIMGSGWTRIQATFMRPTLMGGGPASVNALSGHAIVGFTNRPPPPQ